MKILYGPPGTGKTWQAAREAVQIIDGSVDEATVSDRHRALVESQQIWWVTFHPSYSYEDFVEGFRPTTNGIGQIVYEVRDGPFKKACKACLPTSDAVVFTMGELIGGDRYKVVHVDPSGVVLESDVVRKDAVNPTIRQYVDFWTIDMLRAAGLDPSWLAVPGKDNERKQEFCRQSGLPTTFLANTGPHKAVYEELTRRLTQRTPRPVVLVIDEINRADLSRVFGELMTLIEIDKRSGAAEQRNIFLSYSQENFSVPSELSVIGTMNTADRSLAAIDLALRRRFEFEGVYPIPEKCPGSYGGLDLSSALRSMNRRVTALSSKEHQIGHAEIMESKLEALRLAHKWPDDDSGKARAAAQVFRRKIVPLLLEYFRDDWRLAASVLGIAVGSYANSLIESTAADDLATLVGEIIDLDESGAFQIPLWWDPNSAAWDEAKFRSCFRTILLTNA